MWYTGCSLTRRPIGPFAVSWPRQLGEKNVITITGDILLGTYALESCTFIKFASRQANDFEVRGSALTRKFTVKKRKILAAIKLINTKKIKVMVSCEANADQV